MKLGGLFLLGIFLTSSAFAHVNAPLFQVINTKGNIVHYEAIMNDGCEFENQKDPIAIYWTVFDNKERTQSHTEQLNFLEKKTRVYNLDYANFSKNSVQAQIHSLASKNIPIVLDIETGKSNAGCLSRVSTLVNGKHLLLEKVTLQGSGNSPTAILVEGIDMSTNQRVSETLPVNAL